MTRSEVQKRLLRAAADPHGPNVWIIEPPCTSYCDFLQWSGGTRTFQCPHGGSDGQPLTRNEEVGNQISDFMARLLKTLLKNEKFFLVENPARTGRYPKLWDMPEWQSFQAHKDVEVIPWSFCAWGLQPVDGGRNEFHRKRTWGLAVRVPGLRDVLARACPGTSITHVHGQGQSTWRQVLEVHGSRSLPARLLPQPCGGAAAAAEGAPPRRRRGLGGRTLPG